MSVKIHILTEGSKLILHKALIENHSHSIIDAVSRTIELPDIDVVIVDNPRGVIPEIGVGGYAPTPHLVFVYIDPQHLHIEKTLAYEIECTLSHELHHCARSYTVGYGGTLLEALITEGLADHFEIEMTGVDKRPWSTALDSKDLEVWKEKARAQYNDTQYNHSDWFYGSKEKNIPRWTGYSIGYCLVDDYLKKVQKKASELVSLSANNFV